MATDVFGNTIPDGSTGAVLDDGSTIVDAGSLPKTPDASQATPASVAAATTTTPTKAFGFDDQSFLSTDQQALSRKIQKGFDQSLQQRDRDLARYNAPALSSNIEDEALSRAMALARASNSGAGGVPGSAPRVAAGRGGGGGGGSGRVGGVGSGGVPAGARTAGNGLSPRANSVSGWASLIPWILGSNTISDIQKQGLLRYFLGNKGVTPGAQTNEPLPGDWRAGDTADVLGADPNGDYVSNTINSLDPNFYGDPSGGDLTNLFGGSDGSDSGAQTFPYVDDSVPDFGFSSGGSPDDYSWLTDVLGGGSP